MILPRALSPNILFTFLFWRCERGEEMVFRMEQTVVVQRRPDKVMIRIFLHCGSLFLVLPWEVCFAEMMPTEWN